MILGSGTAKRTQGPQRHWGDGPGRLFAWALRAWRKIFEISGAHGQLSFRMFQLEFDGGCRGGRAGWERGRGVRGGWRCADWIAAAWRECSAADLQLYVPTRVHVARGDVLVLPLDLVAAAVT